MHSKEENFCPNYDQEFGLWRGLAMQLYISTLDKNSYKIYTSKIQASAVPWGGGGGGGGGRRYGTLEYSVGNNHNRELGRQANRMYVQFVQSTQDAENGGIYTEESEKLTYFQRRKYGWVEAEKR